MAHNPGGSEALHSTFLGQYGDFIFDSPHFGGPMEFHPSPSMIFRVGVPKPYGYGHTREYYDDVICCSNIYKIKNNNRIL